LTVKAHPQQHVVPKVSALRAVQPNLASLEKLLNEGIEQLNLSARVSPAQRQNLLQYVLLLEKWNKTFNLTAVREPAQMIGVHILDSLAVVPMFDALADQHFSVLDVGTGAGLPGVVLAIMFPHNKITMLDCIDKKISFVRQSKAQLNLKKSHALCARVEQMKVPGGFDIVISRAYADIAQFIKSTEHLSAPAGRLFAMKGQAVDVELTGLPSHWQVENKQQFNVPQVEGVRYLVSLKRAV
jgi:16S rRNA (guanine527-N7)-methyltransferase